MAAVDLLRLAWQAARDARPGLRDALLTLALAESGPADRPWAERCWARLLANRSDDLMAAFPTWEIARRDDRVAARVAKLRIMFPPARVQRLLQRGNVLRGTYTGRRTTMATLLDDLLGPPGHGVSRTAVTPSSPRVALVSRERASDKPQAISADRRSHQAQSFPLSARDGLEKDNSVYLFYLTVLLAIAMFLASTDDVSGRDSKAA
jgi:hypothetical protein